LAAEEKKLRMRRSISDWPLRLIRCHHDNCCAERNDRGGDRIRRDQDPEDVRAFLKQMDASISQSSVKLSALTLITGNLRRFSYH
jgi:hypothetical protein